MRSRPRTDSNHKAIIATLRKCGCAVQSLAAIGNGCPDLLVSKANHCCVCEVKDGDKSPSHRKLTTDQEQWIKRWKSPVMILTSVNDAILLAGAMR